MSLSIDTLSQIAHLARIETTPEELHEVGKKLDGIFSLIDAMQAVDTLGVEPMSHAQGLVASLRADLVDESNEREKFQLNAPATEAGFFFVPKVIE